MALMLVALIIGWIACVLLVLGMCAAAARADADGAIIRAAPPVAPPDEASVSSAGVRG